MHFLSSLWPAVDLVSIISTQRAISEAPVFVQSPLFTHGSPVSVTYRLAFMISMMVSRSSEMKSVESDSKRQHVCELGDCSGFGGHTSQFSFLVKKTSIALGVS